MGAGDAAGWAEGAVAGKLNELVSRGWYVLHDVNWPGRPKAGLDHVLVGPGGVVVVDDKNWTGEVRVSSGVLWQGRYERTQAVENALAQCAAVASVLAPPHRRLARPLICMPAQPDLFGITNSDVAVAGTRRVVGAIEALPPLLGRQEVVEVYAYLGRQLTCEQEPGITAFRNIRTGPAAQAAERPTTARRVERRPAARRVEGRLAMARMPQAAVPGQTMNRQRVSSRTAKAHQPGSAAGRLVLLAAFVMWAVYVLPYWGR